jgi:hypothetical protein
MILKLLFHFRNADSEGLTQNLLSPSGGRGMRRGGK